MATALLSLFSPARAETALSPAVFGHPDGRGIPVTMDGYSLSMTGTGFFVTKDGYLLTPNHVAGWCQRRAVLRPEGAYEATVVAQNEKADIAVLKSSAPHGVASLAPTRLMPRDTPFVIVRYYHLGGMGSRSAVFASYLGFVPLGSVDVAVRAAQDVVGGNSGSPVVKLDGGVAAMIVAVAKQNPHIGLAISSETLARALEAASVPFNWQSKKLHVTAEAGGGEATAEAIGFTFPIACYRGAPQN